MKAITKQQLDEYFVENDALKRAGFARKLQDSYKEMTVEEIEEVKQYLKPHIDDLNAKTKRSDEIVAKLANLVAA